MVNGVDAVARIWVPAGFNWNSRPFRLVSAAQCLLTCFVKWSLLMNLRSQIEQTNFFSPVCVRLCRDNSSERENCLAHPSQVQTKGFSPEKRKSKFYLAFQLNWEIKITISSSKLMCHYHWCTCMSSDMSFEMRAFVVSFCTIFILTLISPSPINVWFFIRRYWIDDIRLS